MEENLEEQHSELPLSETEATSTNEPITEQETENMEVHHHTHPGHEKKTWKDYFWEFLMLFLAVFCGFLAEYQLEHKIERERAGELAKNFYDELKNDSIMAQLKVQNRIKQETALKDLVHYYKDSSLTHVSKKFALDFEFGISFRTPSQFEPRTIMLEQLKNSGSLRYFKNEELQTLIGDVTVCIKNIYDRQALETQVRMQYLNPIIMQQYDYEFDGIMKKRGKNIFEAIGQYEKSNETIPYHINGVEKLDRQATINILNFYEGNVVSSTRVNFIQKYIEINAALLKLLRKEYHIND